MEGPEPNIRSGTVHTGSQVTSYLESGPSDGLPVVLVHGWPQTAWAWRNQLEGLGARGYRAVAPDLRGAGGSTIYTDHSDYALRHQVADMVALLDGLGIERAVWLGQDWGAPVVWTTARHHPDRFLAAGSLSTPYDTLERGFDRMVSFVNRDIYPQALYPAGQVDYFLFYHEEFDSALAHFEANVPAFFTQIMGPGDPAGQGKPIATATVRERSGWFNGMSATRRPIEQTVLHEIDLVRLSDAYQRTGFFGINSLYMNDADNLDYVSSSPVTRITFPTLFCAGRWDYVNDTEHSRLSEPMRTLCDDLSYRVLDAGHWIHHERAHEVTRTIDNWVQRSCMVPGKT